MTPHGMFHWNELMTRDEKKAMAFYEKTIGWSFDVMPMVPEGTYNVAMHDGKPVAGVVQMQGPNYEGMPEHWMGYLSVDDIDARLKIAVAEGATIVQAPFDIPQVGRIASIKDGGGALIGWMTPAEG